MSDLPAEILFKIFKLLPGKALHMCRGVCSRWKDIVDEISESEWKIICEKEHHFVDRAYENGKLTYKELYKALHMWPKIHSARVVYSRLRGKRFVLLPNGVLSVCLLDKMPCKICVPGYECSEHHELANCIVYYDLNSLTEISRTKYVVPFVPETYKENENLVLMIDERGNAQVEVKPSKFIALNEPEVREAMSFYLKGNKVFALGKNTVLLMDIREDGYDTKRYTTDTMWGDIIYMSYYKNELYIITSKFYKMAQISCLRNEEFEAVEAFIGFKPHILEKYGFYWTEFEMIEWLTAKYKAEMEIVTKFMIRAACRFGTTMLFVTRMHRGKFFVSLSSHIKKQIHFIRSTPFEFGIKFPALKEYTIEVIDAVEVADRHLVLCLLTDRNTIIVFEFNHKFKSVSCEASGTKRQAQPEPGPSTSGLQKKRPKHRFRRSARGRPRSNSV